MKQFTLKDRVGIYGNQPDAIQAMLDYEYYIGKKKTNISWVIDPAIQKNSKGIFELYFFGNEEIKIPFYPTLKEAVASTPADVLVNFASSRSAYGVTKEAVLDTMIDKVIVIAEGIPEREARMLKAYVKETGKYILGPATVGGIVGGMVKLGNAGGTIENVVENRLTSRGSVGIVSKSGGMLNELMTIVSRQTDGICEAMSIGGDRFPVTSLSEQVEIFEKNKDIKMIVLLGEIGGIQEREIAKLVEEKKILKPIVAWISGVGAGTLKKQIQFGHAGAMANSEDETSARKIEVMKKAGILVPKDFTEFESLIGSTAKQIGISPKKNEDTLPSLPIVFDSLMRQGKIRYKKQFVTSISKKRGMDESYLGRDIAETARDKSIGYLMGLLWFKHEFSPEICDIFELCIKLVADHGANVSGAQNTIIAARAGKDLVSSLVSGLLTIGPRFGGAVNASAYYFKWGYDTALPPFKFVEEMKNKGITIPGIGHKVKSKLNPDKRVELLISTTLKTLKIHKYLDYALGVEEVTTRKKDTLILNVDGAMAGIFLDILSTIYTSDEIDKLIDIEALNAFFVYSRTMGLIAHYLDQKRLDQPLYRHPEWDMLEVE